MSGDAQPYLSPEFQARALAEFLARHVTPYNPETDDYDRPPFAEDIKEGKNDPIYNAHAYHTKVPPRSIIPYILHYTRPGDVVLDPFCGSGMTGVAAQMCANPPKDLLEQSPELKDRVGPRACILNDLSPAACHIAYNYNTPVDADALRREFEGVKAAVKDEFDWLYGTEHYEPAIGAYSTMKPEVIARLKNPPSEASSAALLESIEPTWELLTGAEVGSRLGYPVTELPRDDAWGDADMSKIDRWICIPAAIHYTIWSDVYRCEGFVTVEEATGKISTRGKNVGKPIVKKRFVERGCRTLFRLWDVAVDFGAKEVLDSFQCPNCGQTWTIENATQLRTDATNAIYGFEGLNQHGRPSVRRRQRPLTGGEKRHLSDIDSSRPSTWYPTNSIVAGEQGNPFLNRGISSVDSFWTPRDLRALARFWNELPSCKSVRVREALRFLFTSVAVGICSRMTRYNFGKRGNGAMPMRLFFPHFQAEANVLKVLDGKLDDFVTYFQAMAKEQIVAHVMASPAQDLSMVPDNSIDFIFADPPFGRNIAYAELNILWEAWLGRTTQVAKEAITSNGRKWGVESYAAKMQGAFLQMFRILKPGRYAVVEFNNSDPELKLFEQIKLAAISSGFDICGMAILDKQHKSYNQAVGAIRGEDTVDKDVIFNLRKPCVGRRSNTSEDTDLERDTVNAVRLHLGELPGRIQSDPLTYNDEYRTSATIHSMLMNTFIPRGVSVEHLNLSFIERVCSRYFRKIGQHWYLRGEAAGGNGKGGMFEEEVTIKDELTAIDWLRQKVRARPMLIGELKPVWMRAVGLLPADVSLGHLNAKTHSV